jgi:phosphoglycolate phosphatase-like HAD superfamily hydrolase
VATIRLVLWDIDGTLLHAGEAGRNGIAAAYRALTGRDATALLPFHGQTELAYFRELLVSNGTEPSPDLLRRVPDVVAEAFAELGPQMLRTGYPMPGAVVAIRHVGSLHPGVRQSVLTGNIRANAELKLRTFGLADGVEFEIGAYGSDAEHRADLVPVAIARATARTGMRITARNVVLVGDTPRDVEAGRAHGVRVVGVATGAYGAERLRAEGADVVLADLTDLDALQAALTRS